jgi:glycosyltransferase involved in cell wall biosynthesis
VPDVTISVVIATYNRAQLLSLAIASILSQTRAATEIIVVDDGSTDDTARTCETFGDRIRYVRQENAGVSAARNRGIVESSGEWIAICDSDDLWAPDKLEVQVAVISAEPEVRWCATNCLVIDHSGEAIAGQQGFRRAFRALRSDPRSPDEYFSSWLRSLELRNAGVRHRAFVGDFFELLMLGNVVLPSSALVHRDVFKTCGYFNEGLRLAEETEFFHRISSVHNGAMIMTPLVYYRTAQNDALTNPANTPKLMRGALSSLEGAARIRGTLTKSERETLDRGRRRLMSDVAYAELSLYNPRAARDALLELRSSGMVLSAREWILMVATFLPHPILRLLHRLKVHWRSLRG